MAAHQSEYDLFNNSQPIEQIVTDKDDHQPLEDKIDEDYQRQKEKISQQHQQQILEYEVTLQQQDTQQQHYYLEKLMMQHEDGDYSSIFTIAGSPLLQKLPLKLQIILYAHHIKI